MLLQVWPMLVLPKLLHLLLRTTTSGTSTRTSSREQRVPAGLRVSLPTVLSWTQDPFQSPVTHRYATLYHSFELELKRTSS